MEFNEYQKKAFETAIYPNKGDNIVYPALGIGGETGEVLKKFMSAAWAALLIITPLSTARFME